jgi:serine/threonine-protein kinase
MDDDFAVGSTLGMPPGEQPSGELELGAMLGRFRLKHRLGQGGMGVVFAGEDVQLGRPVAIKVVRGDTDHQAYRARLLREAQALARLEHPNVVRVYEVNTDRDRLFIAMELVDGVTLTAWHREPHSWKEIVAMYRQVGAGLAAVHHAGLVHRDFKPDNVLVDLKGVARVADFGLARLTATDEKSPMAPLTGTGVMMGTPGYMAPEQMVGADVDARADQYSFCVALREALGGRPLDETRWASVPSDVRAVIGRGLSYDPDERFRTMDDLLAALERTTRGREPRWMVALLVLFVLGAVAGVVAFASSRGDHQVASVPIAASPTDAATPMTHVEVIVDEAVDAGVAMAPNDASVIVVKRVTPPPADHAPRAAPDAGVAPDAGAAVVVAGSGAASLPVQVPTTKHLPVAQVTDPGHLAVVRAATTDLGYDGIDLRELPTVEREATAALDTAAGSELAIAQVKLGMAKRRHGDCSGALKLWADAMKTLKFDEPADATWRARAAEATGLCQLGWGNPDAASTSVSGGWVHGNHDEISLLMGFIAYEQGKKDEAYALLLTAERKPDAKVQASLKAWLDGLGLGLR